LLASRQIANTGDTGVANRILISMPGRESKAVVKNSRDVRARDFKIGNFVLLGSEYSNPWTGLVCKDTMNFEFAADRPGGPGEIRNQNPRPGEQTVYRSRAEGLKSGISYARIALVSI
jgi:hypothetical protein